ncbi:Na+/H+ antiporter subunit E [Candidatus Sumerlaeota bacterium]|nr:Na+/H+ antiporter subunit E [Candidatus Sumerlaeota bacterium]
MEKFRNFIYLFILLMLVWLALTSSLEPQKLAAGVIISLGVSLFTSAGYLGLGLPSPGIRKIAYSILYLIVLLIEIIKANFDVAYRVLHPKMPIKPGIVVIKTKLKQDIAKVILANSITLTPGTFTLDIQGDNLLIHWIYVKGEGWEERAQIICGKFERILRIIFE